MRCDGLPTGPRRWRIHALSAAQQLARDMTAFIASLPFACERLCIRLLRLSDLASFHRYRSDPEVARLQGWSPMSRPEARQFLQEHAAVRSLRPCVWSQFGIATWPDDLLIGDVGICLSEDRSQAEFGLSISPDHQGRGYGSETVSGIISALFLDPRLRLVRASADTRNAPCLAALRSAGMTHRHTHEGEYKGERCVEDVFCIERCDAR